MKIAAALITTILVTGCTGVHRGVVAMKINDTQAHVCLNKDEVRPGDTVKIYRNICSSQRATKPALVTCEKHLLGKGTISEVLNDHYSVVTLPVSLDIREGDFVERQD